MCMHADFALDWNYCASGPCLNGGTCTNVPTSFSCSCPNGYSGSFCKEESKLNKPCYLLFNLTMKVKA